LPSKESTDASSRYTFARCSSVIGSWPATMMATVESSYVGPGFIRAIAARYPYLAESVS
jgi:hypothetical protein